ncbi:hypothetical protein [Roseobacter sp. HKCCA0434]|uniref:hypothetical protein n=1 Tax=Roseobacter sp. HKCCA0434 TaxID=3079297 RepID=UPI002905D7B6|nr:hypothetical protein [Roseobacter sp. HKCCA0434]
MILSYRYTCPLALCIGLAGTSLAQSASPSVEDYAEAVIAYAQADLQDWIADPFVLYAVEEQNERHAGLDATAIERLDRSWMAEDGYGPMIFDLLDRQASILMRERREAAGGIITEIILMDRYGLNAGISDPTSDFYQGDEAKYQETFLISPDAIYVSEVEFDDSTGVDQTQVSLAVTSPETGEPIGAVTFGIDLSRLTR